MDEQAKVLLVDADAAERESLRGHLVDEWQVLAAGDGIGGLELLNAHTPDVILVAQELPDMTGLDFLLRSLKLSPSASRLMLGQGSTSDLARASVAHCLPKPVDALRLRALLKPLRRSVHSVAGLPNEILLVEDDASLRPLVMRQLERVGHKVRGTGDGAEALRMIEEQPPDLLLLDYMLPNTSGIEVLEQVRREHPEIVVMMLSGHTTVELVERAIEHGAYDYVSKPFNTQEFLFRVHRALERRGFQREIERLRAARGDGSLVVRSAGMRRVLDAVEMVLQVDSTVLVRGETGTGKEVIARYIHRNGTRARGPFVAINCAALTGTLLESELFGHERGAFTGAVSQKQGKFEAAAGGTVLLDEVGDVPLETQVKLLRVLQEREFERVGGNEVVHADIRVLAATNRDLEQLVRDGRFREDLYYRLNVVPITLPPLRERLEELPYLVAHFVQKFARAFNKPVTGVGPHVLGELSGYDWPGNVRQLEHIIERAVVMCRGDVVEAVDLPRPAAGAAPQAWALDGGLREVVAKVERAYVEQLLKKHKGNVSRAAEEAGLNRRNFFERMRKFELDRARFK